MFSPFICWFVFFVISSVIPEAAYAQMKDLRQDVFIKGEAHYLNVSRVGTFTEVYDHFDCTFECLSNPSCLSLNLAASKGADGKLWCELLSSDKYRNPEEYKENNTSHHFSIKTPCMSSPCHNGGSCMPNYKYHTFDCSCGEGFIGEYCERLKECRGQALGLENKVLPNSAMTASSTQSSGDAWLARLNNMPNVHSGAWRAQSSQAGEWLQIDLGEKTIVTKLATQGRTSSNHWVTSYKILFSFDGAKWVEYKENDTVKVFAANSDANTIVSHELTTRFMARYVRFSVVSWSNAISMRAELYGCVVSRLT